MIQKINLTLNFVKIMGLCFQRKNHKLFSCNFCMAVSSKKTDTHTFFMKGYYEGISALETKDEFIRRFLTFLNVDEDLSLSAFQECMVQNVEYYDLFEIEAIECNFPAKHALCYCDLATTDWKHNHCCLSSIFKFDKSYVFRCYRAIHGYDKFENLVHIRSHVWNFYKKYFFVWQRFCIPRFLQLKLFTELSQFLLADLGNLCLDYVDCNAKVEIVGSLFFPISYGGGKIDFDKLRSLPQRDWHTLYKLCACGDLETFKTIYDQFQISKDLMKEYFLRDALKVSIAYQHFHIARYIYWLAPTVFSQDVSH